MVGEEPVSSVMLLHTCKQRQITTLLHINIQFTKAGFTLHLECQRQILERKQDVLLLSHHDKRLINMISTLHTAAVVDDISRYTGVTKKKPKCIVDYRTHVHGVDTADQYLAYYPFIHKTVKQPKKVFFSTFSNVHFSTVMLYLKNPTLIPTNHS
jgi:hypothetical protein